MRKSIFYLLNNCKTDILKEYNRIYTLFEETKFEGAQSILYYIDKTHFLNWKYRKRFLSIYEMMSELKLSKMQIVLNLNTELLITYIEFIINVTKPMERDILSFYGKQTFNVLKQNINNLLEELNYRLYRNREGQVFIIENDNKITAIAEKFPDISDKVIEYRRFALKGDIVAKREILLKLSDKIEPIRKKLNATSYKNIIEDINMLLNNLNIRHNNLEGKYKKEHTINMTQEELEKWYDKTYDMILGSLILEDYIDTKNELEELKKNY